MSYSIKILNSEVFVFILVIFIVIISVGLFRIFKPEKGLKYNFNPYPKIVPTNLPDSVVNNNCADKLQFCSESSQCIDTCGSDYVCTTVNTEGSRVFNNIRIPQGKWCLPKQENTSSCNEFTGRWIWVDDPGYCNGINGKNQCWKCNCLYPDIYGDPSGGCIFPHVCKNIDAISLDQPDNILVSSTDEDKVWDPLADNNVARENPYSKDENGNPIFQCSCEQNSNEAGQKFVRLPNDPYNCHLDPCYPQQGYLNKGYVCDKNGVCQCDCNLAGSGYFKAKTGKYQGLCVDPGNACTNGSWNEQQQKCNCAPGYHQRSCNPGCYNNRTPDCCINPDNPLGQECVSPCVPNPCQNGGICASSSPTSYSCTCPGTSGGKVWCDNQCSKLGFPSGFTIDSTWCDSSGNCHDNRVGDKSECCSGDAKVHPNSSGGADTRCT